MKKNISVSIAILILFTSQLYANELLEIIVEYNKQDISIVSYQRVSGDAVENYEGEYLLSALDMDMNEIFFTTFDIPLLIDVPPDPITDESYQIKVEKNSTVVRIPFDSRITDLRINSKIFKLNSVPFVNPLPAPTTEVIYGNCLGTNCFDLIFVADGYNNLSQFKTDAQAFANFFGTVEPYKSNLDRMRITRVDNTISLGCYNNCNGIQRLICCNSNKVFSAVSGLNYDEILVITNMNEYGGSGYVDSSSCAEKGTYAVTFRDISYYAKEVAVHEVGHSFGGLWDEYEYGIHGSGEGPNCVRDSTCAKWKGVSGTGCYAGCSYNGMYRPTDNTCLMRTLTPTGGYKFCPVCKNTIDAKLKNCFSSSCTPNCVNKECGDDGCGGSCGSCTTVPMDYCFNSTTLRDYTGAVGSCSSGKCSYPYTDKNCQYGCSNGKCNSCTPSCVGKECGDDGCGGSCGSCNNPPPDTCVDIQTLRDYSPYGSCSNNKCVYQYVDKKCDYICELNRCVVDPFVDAGIDVKDVVELSDVMAKDIISSDTSQNKDIIMSDSTVIDTGSLVDKENLEENPAIDTISSGCSCSVID